MTVKRNVLFLCTGNSCRSQLAEAIVNARLGDTWAAVSAGTQPTGYVHPLALQVLAEIGIVPAHPRSKSTDEFRSAPFDLVVTVCDDADKNCPNFSGKVGKRLHIGFPDPARATGTDAEKLAVFRKVLNDIRAQFQGFYATHIQGRN